MPIWDAHTRGRGFTHYTTTSASPITITIPIDWFLTSPLQNSSSVRVQGLETHASCMLLQCIKSLVGTPLNIRDMQERKEWAEGDRGRGSYQIQLLHLNYPEP